LGVFGLSERTSENELKELFNKYGELEKIDLIHDKRTGISRGFGFIYFKTMDDAVKAKEAMNGSKVDGYCIRTDFSLTEKPHNPTPGRYMGRPDSRRRDAPRRHYNRYPSDDRHSPYRRSPKRYSPYYDRERRHYRDDRDRDRDRYYDDRY